MIYERVSTLMFETLRIITVAVDKEEMHETVHNWKLNVKLIFSVNHLTAQIFVSLSSSVNFFRVLLIG